MRTWEKRDYNKAKVNPAANFAQRDYDDVEAQLMEELKKDMEEYAKKNGGEA